VRSRVVGITVESRWSASVRGRKGKWGWFWNSRIQSGMSSNDMRLATVQLASSRRVPAPTSNLQTPTSPRLPSPFRRTYPTARQECGSGRVSTNLTGQESCKLTRIASRPCVRTFLPCSRTMMNGRPFWMSARVVFRGRSGHSHVCGHGALGRADVYVCARHGTARQDTKVPKLDIWIFPRPRPLPSCQRDIPRPAHRRPGRG